MLNAPRYRLDLSDQQLQLAVPSETVAAPIETVPEQAIAGTEAREQPKNEFGEGDRAAREEERRARRRLRQAEAAISQEREVEAGGSAREQNLEPGVLIQDYLRQIEAIQREASDDTGALQDATRQAPAPEAASPDGLPPNPYPN